MGQIYSSLTSETAPKIIVQIPTKSLLSPEELKSSEISEAQQLQMGTSYTKVEVNPYQALGLLFSGNKIVTPDVQSQIVSGLSGGYPDRAAYFSMTLLGKSSTPKGMTKTITGGEITGTTEPIKASNRSNNFERVLSYPVRAVVGESAYETGLTAIGNELKREQTGSAELDKSIMSGLSSVYQEMTAPQAGIVSSIKGKGIAAGETVKKGTKKAAELLKKGEEGLRVGRNAFLGGQP
jgi:hypothetical protein